MQLTCTNRSCGLTWIFQWLKKPRPLWQLLPEFSSRCSSECGLRNQPSIALRIPLRKRFPAVLAEGPHPFPFRTRKLSPPAPMILHGKPCGNVGHRRNINQKAAGSSPRLFFCPRPLPTAHCPLPAAHCRRHSHRAVIVDAFADFAAEPAVADEVREQRAGPVFLA